MVDFAAFHSPFNKLVQKSFARLLYNDFLDNPDAPEFMDVQHLKKCSIRKELS